MGTKLRVATWNLDRSGVRRRNRVAPQIERLESVQADILVLTETHESVVPRGYEHHIASRPESGYHQPGESYVSIWSRYPLTEIPTARANRYFTICAEIFGPPGIGNLVVYGTIITYGADGVSEGVPAWKRHRDAVASQTSEWEDLGRRYPDHLRILAGDFNENMDGKRWYGVKDAKAAILSGLNKAGMHCPTAAPDLSLLAGEGALSRSTVNHVCVSEKGVEVLAVLAWEGKCGGLTLSDHNGILIDVRRESRPDVA